MRNYRPCASVSACGSVRAGSSHRIRRRSTCSSTRGSPSAPARIPPRPCAWKPSMPCPSRGAAWSTTAAAPASSASPRSRLGAARLLAVDNDPQALLPPPTTPQRNGVDSSTLHICQPGAYDASTWRGRADVVIANILAGPLEELRDTLCDLLAPGGTLLLAGLLDTQAAGAGRPLRAAHRPGGARAARRVGVPRGTAATGRLNTPLT
jgi:hypothetical protein